MKRTIVTGFALFAAASAAHAGGTYVGRIRPVHYGTLYLDASATQMSNRPACATRAYVRLQEAPTDNAYKEKFSMILAAWFAKEPLVLSGTGSCTSEGDEIIYVVSFP